MIDWTVIGPSLADVVTGLAVESTGTESPPFCARWSEAKAGFVDPRMKGEVILRILSTSEIGEPEIRFRVDPAGTKECIVGQERVVIEIVCSSFDHEFKTWCLATAGRIRYGLRRTTVQQALQVLNASLVEVGPTRDVTFTFDGHRVNAVAFELTCNFGTHSDSPLALDVIEHIEATSLLEIPDGTLLSEPPNYTDRLMP